MSVIKKQQKREESWTHSIPLLSGCFIGSCFLDISCKHSLVQLIYWKILGLYQFLGPLLNSWRPSQKLGRAGNNFNRLWNHHHQDFHLFRNAEVTEEALKIQGCSPDCDHRIGADKASITLNACSALSKDLSSKNHKVWWKGRALFLLSLLCFNCGSGSVNV